MGYRSEHVVTDLGINASLGSGQEWVEFLNDERPVDATQRLLYVFLATTYEF